MPQTRSRKASSKHFAIIGAGIAGVACARTLVQAGHRVTVFEQADRPGGRMASEDSPFGSFDSGAQYFTVRDPRFMRVIQIEPELCRPWSANAVRVLDAHGRVAEAALPSHEPHFVAQPGMGALVRHWAAPLGDALVTGTEVTGIEADALDAQRWQLRTRGADDSQHVYSGFDAVLLATPPNAARRLLEGRASALVQQMAHVQVAPCWTLMIAFPNASQPTLPHLGPQWNAARSTHHRVAWLARESSKPGRQTLERWTVQASPKWSTEHLRDDPQRVQAKLLRAFSEITGIRAEPGYALARCWPEAQTSVPAGRPHLWDAKTRLGAAGDWCTGHRVEEAFLSGLSLALAVA
ncbi:FAD-dependent oxidoreductase [Variovorax dokdonensis]|uniref:FAD-dependent oxidoreductase n=1 Tax=Variovorax dokdonensis TaxID=344883 RepID=A0ABT7ND12_9BURK|nr:FAD-dependent oxidoreductase [Variovorax dokdonensis]MDM0045844.1 FAD-dependent oxidoreductase [Variovorax dokdonensis]